MHEKVSETKGHVRRHQTLTEAHDEGGGGGGAGRAKNDPHFLRLPQAFRRLGSYRCCGLLTLPREPTAGHGIVALAANNARGPGMLLVELN